MLFMTYEYTVQGNYNVKLHCSFVCVKETRVEIWRRKWSS